jgi:hypothetical protein
MEKNFLGLSCHQPGMATEPYSHLHLKFIVQSKNSFTPSVLYGLKIAPIKMAKPQYVIGASQEEKKNSVLEAASARSHACQLFDYNAQILKFPRPYSLAPASTSPFSIRINLSYLIPVCEATSLKL